MIIPILVCLIFYRFFKKDIRDIALEFRIDSSLPWRTWARLTDIRNLYWSDWENTATQALYFHCDLGSKIHEMINDPLTSHSDWKALLPVCIETDKWYAKAHPYIKNPSRTEDMVREIMA